MTKERAQLKWSSVVFLLINSFHTKFQKLGQRSCMHLGVYNLPHGYDFSIIKYQWVLYIYTVKDNHCCMYQKHGPNQHPMDSDNGALCFTIIVLFTVRLSDDK